MYYIAKQTIYIKADFEEPIYDHAPSYGTYMQDVTIRVPPYTGIYLNKKGDVKSVDIPDLELGFGVSMHRGSLHFRENLKNSIGTILLLVSDTDYDKICEINEKIEELEEKLTEKEYLLSCYEDSDDELYAFIKKQDGISQEDYEKLSEQLWNSCIDYVSCIFESQRIKERFNHARWNMQYLINHLEQTT